MSSLNGHVTILAVPIERHIWADRFLLALTFNSMCVAELGSLCESLRMMWLIRSFLALLFAVSLLWATVSDVSAGLTLDSVSMTEPCCEGDCPDDLECETSCAMMARCGMLVLWPLDPPLVAVTTQETVVISPTPDRHPPSGLSPDGLRRPPRT